MTDAATVGALTGLPANWGATAAELGAGYPCDSLLPRADEALFRAVSVAAPPATVFRWVCQLRAAPYSYDLLDNFGRQSPQELTPGLERLEVGQRVMTIFRLADFATNEHMTIRLANGRRVFGDVAVTYAVHPAGPRGSRLIAKLVVRDPGPLGALRTRALAWGDLVMMRRQLLNLRELAEGSAQAAA